MESTRETREFTTPAGVVVVLKTYLSARERNAIIEAMPEDIPTDGEGKPDMERLTTVNQLKLTRAIVENVVVSVNGKTEGATDALLDGRDSDYDAVVAEASSVMGGNLTSAK